MFFNDTSRNGAGNIDEFPTHFRSLIGVHAGQRTFNIETFIEWFQQLRISHHFTAEKYTLLEEKCSIKVKSSALD